MKYFTNCKTAEDLKKEYRRLAKEFHPDLNPNADDSVMKEINNEYDKMFERLKNVHANAKGETYTATTETTEAPEDFRAIINDLMKCDGIIIDLVGAWIWVTGNTYPHKNTLKNHGFKWASKKKAWYWRSEENASHNRKRMTLDEIKDIYGCETYRSRGTKALTA